MTSRRGRNDEVHAADPAGRHPDAPYAGDVGPLSADEQGAVYAAYKAINETAGVTPGVAMQPPELATTVRVHDGKTLTTDGPFVTVKEALGGYLHFEADDLDAAIELAARISGGEHGRGDRDPPSRGVVDPLEQVFRDEWARVLAALIGFLGDFDLARGGRPRRHSRSRQPVGRGRERPRIRALARHHGAQPRHRPPSPRPHARGEGAPARRARGRGGRRGRIDDSDERLERVFAAATGTQSSMRRWPDATGTRWAAYRGDRPRVPRPGGDDGEAPRSGEAQAKAAAIPSPFLRRACSDRLAAVLGVCYLIFNEGYSRSRRTGRGGDPARPRARRAAAGRARGTWSPGADAGERRRRGARFADGTVVLLRDQDRSLWNLGQIEEGRATLDRAVALGGRGPYILQAAIAMLHVDDPPDWPQLAALYGSWAASRARLWSSATGPPRSPRRAMSTPPSR